VGVLGTEDAEKSLAGRGRLHLRPETTPDLIPSELEQFFQQMLESVDPMHREQAYATFAVIEYTTRSEDRASWPSLRYWALFEYL
jgi:hypothetical protein